MKWRLEPGWIERVAKVAKETSDRDESRFNINFYMDRHKLFPRYVMLKLVDTSRGYGHLYASQDVDQIYPGLSVAFGKDTIHKIVKPCLQDGAGDLLYVDHAYFDRGYRWKGVHSGNPPSFRIVANGIHPTKIERRPADRFEKFNIKLKPWKTEGEYVLVCPPTGFFSGAMGMKPNWLKNTMKIIRANTDRPIRVRPKPGGTDIRPIYRAVKGISNAEVLSSSIDRPIQVDLKGAWACVAPASATSIEAIIEGVPIFTEKISPAQGIAVHDYRYIEYPIYPDREPLLYHLAYCQFEITEIESGHAFDFLVKNHKRLFKAIRKSSQASKIEKRKKKMSIKENT